MTTARVVPQRIQPYLPSIASNSRQIPIREESDSSTMTCAIGHGRLRGSESRVDPQSFFNPWHPADRCGVRDLIRRRVRRRYRRSWDEWRREPLRQPHVQGEWVFTGRFRDRDPDPQRGYDDDRRFAGRHLGRNSDHISGFGQLLRDILELYSDRNRTREFNRNRKPSPPPRLQPAGPSP